MSGTSRWLRRAALILVALAVACGTVWWLWQRPGHRDADATLHLQVNNRGVGRMERFEYEAAVKDFEEVVALAPRWLPGKINLGIALLNTVDQPSMDRAVTLFEEVLKQEPDNPYAHHCIGLIYDYRSEPEAALPHFEAVTRKDPDDGFAWFYLGKSLHHTDERRAMECYERALQLNPYINVARYKLNDLMRFIDFERSKALSAEHEKLKAAHWATPPDLKNRYTEMGFYAMVIGRYPEAPAPAVGPLPTFEREAAPVELTSGATWATREALRGGAHGELRAAVRERFGGILVVLDYDRDGVRDVLLLGAVLEKGQVRDLLLRGDDKGAFRDVTEKAGLAGARSSLGCLVADFDNDGIPDLLFTCADGVRLLHNTGKGAFEDVTAAAHLDDLKTVCLGAVFVDLDQDGDLDLLVSQYAATPEAALANLAGKSPVGPGLAAYLNAGLAPDSNMADPPPLKPDYRRVTEPAALLGPACATVNLAAVDVDLDFDLDLLVLADGVAPVVVFNDRLLRFHRSELPADQVPPGAWNGALVLDANHDGQSDLFLVRHGGPPRLLESRPTSGVADLAKRYVAGATNAPPLKQALALDVDHDGWTDVLGFSAEGRPVLLHNRQGKLEHAKEGLGTDANWPPSLTGLATTHRGERPFADLVLWEEGKGLHFVTNKGNDNRALRLELSGHRRVSPSGTIARTNADGFGAWVVAQAGTHWTGAEYTTLSAGLGQSRQPLVLGLGQRAEADVVRVRWPDIVWQAELSVSTSGVFRIDETNRKRDSCPVIFTWDGERWVYVTDCLGAGTVGETMPDRTCNVPRPEESVKIEPHQLRPKDGHLLVKVAEPMSEITYLDRLQLVVLDHPADVRAYPDERFALSGPAPTQELFAFREAVAPQTARDHRGRNVTARLRSWDRDTVDGFARRLWLGFAEDHYVELDFGDRLARFGPSDRLVLFLAGWTDYAYPEAIWAANQAGVPVRPPTLERLDDTGKWQTIAEVGFPAGLPRMMTFAVTGKLTGPRCVLRLVGNQCVYWDQVFVAPLLRTEVLRRTVLEVSRADLASRGCAQEFSPDGREPTAYDHDRLNPSPTSSPAGRVTRFGDVTELLTATDDCFAIFGPGEEVTARFDARGLPALPAGWVRSYVLRTYGYCKGCGPFTQTGATVEPLPFRAMSKYPYGTEEAYPSDEKHEAYRRKYNTRVIGRGQR